MHDPREGVAADGTIMTGARRDRVPATFEPVVLAAVDQARSTGGDPQLYLYGSVATGQAVIGRSDVDLLSVGLPAESAAAISTELSLRFRTRCRAVEIGAAQPPDFVGDDDAAYGNRVFLRHYCVQVGGPPRADRSAAFPADRRAARGFNGDIAAHVRRWSEELDHGTAPDVVANRLARKTLLAVAGLVSVHDRTWTTDRHRAARRWAEIRTTAATDMAVYVRWSDIRSAGDVTGHHVRHMVDRTAGGVVEDFRELIGLWPAT